MSTDISPNHFVLNKLTRCSSNTTATVIPTSAGIPGFAMGTAADVVIAIPIEHPGDNFGLMIITDAASSEAYAVVDIAYGNGSTDPAPMSGVAYANLSTVDLAWKSFISTAVIGTVTASEAVAYTLMIDTAKFAHNFGATSSAIQDAYESFIYVTVGQSTTATGSGHNADNAVISAGVGHFVGAFQVPQ